jgi:predicted  nucleic acid-binding Zn-ribbon protein
MSSPHDSSLQAIKKRLTDFQRAYQSLKEELESRSEEVKTLKSELVRLEGERDKMETELETVRMAQSLSGQEGDTGATKRKIDAMVREIDRCIALLND